MSEPFEAVAAYTEARKHPVAGASLGPSLDLILFHHDQHLSAGADFRDFQAQCGDQRRAVAARRAGARDARLAAPGMVIDPVRARRPGFRLKEW